MFKQRRDRLMALMGPRAVAVVPSARVFARNNDVEHEYRQDSDLYYLAAFEEPESALVLAPGHAEHRAVLFLRPSDPEREAWDGARTGVDGVVAQFGIDQAFPIGEFDAKLTDILTACTRLYYALGVDRTLDDRVLAAISRARGRARKMGTWPTEIVDPSVLLHELRWRKEEAEIAIIRRAAEVTRDAFTAAFTAARPGVHEYEIEGVLRGRFRSQGSERPAYPPIVASGPNACVLHHVTNNRRMEDGDLLLIDAGAEFGSYASDVTRTFPVNGRFSPAQKHVYELVLKAQEAAIAKVAPGANLEGIHDAAVEVIAEGLVALGLLDGPAKDRVEDKSYKRYFMHGTSHWLGLDVHDVGRYHTDGTPRALEPGCVLTVEPGVYVSPTDEQAPPEFRGIGVRVEDDVLCTANGSYVISHDIPKRVSDLEAALGNNARRE